MSRMISSLPRDLIEEIISRVPLRYMKALRLTCKNWNNLSKSESFTKMHIGKGATREEKSMLIKMMPHNLYLMSLVVDDVDPFVKLKVKGQLSFLDNQVSIDQVFHCEGLLLCILKDVTRIVVWNPYLGQTRWIKLRYSQRLDRCNRDCYALGYEDKKSCRSFKVLRFFDYYQGKLPETQFLWYELYDFDSGLWTTLDVTPHWIIYFSLRGVSLKGNTYWPGAKGSSSGITDHIICFDFRREKFGPLLPLPVDFRDNGYVYVTLSCVKEEKLAALFQHHFEDESEIWITTKIEVEMVSWSKFLKLDTSPQIKLRGTFFIDEEKKFCMGSEISDDRSKTFINIIGEEYLRKLYLGLPQGRYCWPPVCFYVPSLVQIKKPARGEMVKQTRLEERHRFAQNKLRLAAFEKLVKTDRPGQPRCRQDIEPEPEIHVTISFHGFSFIHFSVFLLLFQLQNKNRLSLSLVEETIFSISHFFRI